MYRRKWTFAAAIAVSVVMVMGQTSVSASSAVLKRNVKGNEVTILQKDLKRLGYLSADATGFYGNATKEAVMKLQREYGYAADGIAGQKTRALLERLSGRNNTQTATPVNSTASVNSNNAAGLLKKGDKNNSVKSMQENLIKLGYLHTGATGLYGSATAAAVKKLQRKYGYTADGIAGNGTLTLISKLSSGVAENKAATAVKAATMLTSAEAENSSKTVQSSFMPPWFNNVENKFAVGDTATVYDIESGKSFMVKRTYGHNHADCEALTARDTAAMKAIFGGSWSWQRRAVIVSVNGLKLAASMSGMPHAGLDRYPANKTVSSRSGGYRRGTNLDAVKNNKMNGVFDIHFYKSRNHYNNRVDKKHQALVKQAASWAAEHYQ